jgi:hypothetical protein
LETLEKATGESLMWKEKKPEAGQNWKTKKIWVSNFFWGINRKICIRISALPDTWERFQKDFLKSQHVAFEDIVPYIDGRTSQESVKELKEYYQFSHAEFAWDFYNYFILPSTKETLPKPRRVIHKKLSKEELLKIKLYSQHVYAFLRKGDPAELKSIKKYFKDIVDEPKSATMVVIEQHFPHFGINLIADPKTFYKKYIAFEPISPLIKMYEETENPQYLWPLREIFF